MIGLFFVLGTVPALGQTPASREIRSSSVRIVAEHGPDGYKERLFAREGDGWKEILVAGNPRRSDPSLAIGGAETGLRWTTAGIVQQGKDPQVLLLEGRTSEVVLRKSIRLEPDAPIVHIFVTAEFRDSVVLNHLLTTYSFVPGKPDFVFTPQLRPDPDDVIADHTFRAPAFILQKGGAFAAMVPDLKTIDGKNRQSKSGADLRVDGDQPLVSFGLLPWEKKNHVYYSHSERTVARIARGSVQYGFSLHLSARAPVGRGYQNIVRYHWERYGHENFMDPIGPQSLPFSAYIKKSWQEFVPSVALSTEYGGKPVTLLRQARLAWSNKLHKAADNDNWFNVWFNSLRTAYGMYLHAMKSGDEHLMGQAVGNLNLALLAPQQNGIAPSVFYSDSTGGHWVADHAWGGIREGKMLPMFHNAWTNYWLLEWSALLPGRRAEILAYTGRFADFLLKQQLSSGVIPSWYDPVSLEPAPEFRYENAETAGAALFLAEYFRATGDRRYLEAAERAMAYVTTAIVPEHKWFDYETFFSCSRKQLGFFDAHTGQHPQNTLSMHQAAEAYLSLYQLTGKQEYREQGIAVMDYLCLYQQVWSPEWLSCELMGGFGVQNTDGEWSDSRQGYFAVTLVRYYELTGKREYFERGIAALRAMFSLFESPASPRTAENYAHAAADQLAGVTGLHWGTGSSVVSIHLIEQKYGEAFVDVSGGWGVGIDGCRITGVDLRDGSLKVEIRDNLKSPRTLRVTFGKMKDDVYNVTVNGRAHGSRSREELQKGISIGL